MTHYHLVPGACHGAWCFDELAAVTENEDKVRDAYAKLRHLI